MWIFFKSWLFDRNNNPSIYYRRKEREGEARYPHETRFSEETIRYSQAVLPSLDKIIRPLRKRSASFSACKVNYSKGNVILIISAPFSAIFGGSFLFCVPSLSGAHIFRVLLPNFRLHGNTFARNTCQSFLPHHTFLLNPAAEFWISF